MKMVHATNMHPILPEGRINLMTNLQIYEKKCELVAFYAEK